MKKRFADKTACINWLGRRGVGVDGSTVIFTNGTVGLKVLGAIDYLKNYHKMHVKAVKVK